MKLNKAENTEYQALVKEGWTVYRNGWPDFLAEKGGKFRLVEVKSTADRLSPAQKRMAAALLRLTGLEMEVKRWKYTPSTKEERIEKKRAKILAWMHHQGPKP